MIFLYVFNCSHLPTLVGLEVPRRPDDDIKDPFVSDSEEYDGGSDLEEDEGENEDEDEDNEGQGNYISDLLFISSKFRIITANIKSI